MTHPVLSLKAYQPETFTALHTFLEKWWKALTTREQNTMEWA